MAPAAPLLSVRDLSLAFETRRGPVRPLDSVSLEVGRGEVVAVVGESGSGKSVLALTILGLLDASARIGSGAIRFDGQDLLALAERERAQIRGRRISMVYQDPRLALNPIRAIGNQLGDVLSRHFGLRGAALERECAIALRAMRIGDAERRLQQFPFELSGGLCQRVMIALALACQPDLLIADEATTALDTTTQRSVLDLLIRTTKARGMAVILVTHSLGLAAQYADRMVVMHAGQVVESGGARQVVDRAAHPYTRKLLASSPEPGRRLFDLVPIGGAFPDLGKPLPACRFAGRCERAGPACLERPLPTFEMAADHIVRCWLPQ